MRTSAKALTVGSLLTASMFITPAALAATSDAEITITAGSLTAGATDVVLSGVTTSHADQAPTGSVDVTVDDATGSGDGWTVSQQVGDFSYTGDNGGTAITAVNFSVTSIGAVSQLAGVDDATTVTAGAAGALDSARIVLSAEADGGEGTYAAPVNVQLDVPAGSRAGTYAATLTTTAAPAL